MHIGRELVWALIAVVGLAATVSSAQTSEPPEGPELVPSTPQPGDGTEDKPGKPAGEEQDPEKPPPPPEDSRSPLTQWGPIVLIAGAFLLLYLITSRSRRKRETQRKEMLASLQKGDKITSIGGVVGTVIEVREDEVTVKVDETNNVRMKFARWAIRGVGSDAKKEGPGERK